MRVRHRLILALLLFVACALLASRVRVTSDLSRLMPAEGEFAAAFWYLERFEVADTLLVEVDGTGTDRGTLLEAVDDLGARLESDPAIAAVRYRVDLHDLRAMQGAVGPHAIELIPADQLEARLSPEGLREVLEAQVVRLAGPGGFLLERAFLEDPLDLTGLALAELERLHLFRVEVMDGHFLHESGERAVLFVEPRLSPMEMGPDAPLVAHLEEVFDTCPLPVSWLGSHRFAEEAARSMRDDVSLAGALGIGLLLLLFLVGFRSFRPVAGAVGPVALVVAATAGAAGLIRPIHGINLGFAGALLGLSLDYWIHLYVAAAARGIPETFHERVAVAREAFRELLPALLIGAASTSGAFLVLTLSHYPVVRHLGALGATAAAAALLGTWLLGPLTWALFGARPLSHVAAVRSPTWARLVFLGTTALALLFAMDTSFDGDPRNLVRVSPELQRTEELFSSRYGGFGTGGMVVLEGPGEEVLDDAARVQAALGKVPGVDAVGPGVLLPGPETRARRRAALPDEAVLQERIERAGAEVGFTPEALEGVAARIRATPAQPLSSETWQGTPMEALVNRHVRREGGRVAAMISLVVGDETLVEPIEAVVSQAAPHAEMVLPARLATRGMESLLGEMRRMGSLSVVGVLLLLLLRYRDPRRVLAALAPCGAALAWAFGAMALLGVAWNAVSIAALVLILGLGLDYGVFVLEGTLRGDRGVSRRAVLLSALTTIAGFGILGVTRSPALFGVGLAVLVGLGAAGVTALVVVPPLSAGEPLLPAGLARWSRRAAFAVLVLLNVEVLALLLAYPAPPPPGEVPGWQLEEPSPGDRRWGPNRLLHRQGVWSEYLVGDPYVRGYAGGLLGADLQARLERETHEALREHVPRAAARWAILRASLLLAPRLDRTFTEAQRLEIRGAVDADPSGDDRLAPPYTRRVYYHAIHDIGQALVDAPFVTGCTGFMAGGAATADGHWLLARNFDFEGSPAFDRDKVVVFVQPDDGIPFVSVSFANMVGVVTGMNAEHLAIALQAGGADAPIHVGMPMTLVAREVLQHAATLDDAEAILRARRGFVAENVLVVDGDAGMAALFEVSPARVVRVPVAGAMGVSNHFRSQEFADDRTNQRRIAESTTAHRLERMEELLERWDGRLDMDTAVRILRDRAGVGDRALPPGHRWALDAHVATHSVVMDASAGRLWVSRYPNTSGGYVAYDLQRGLAGDIEPIEVVPVGDVREAFDVHRARAILRRARRASPGEAESLALQALELMPGHPEALGVLAGALVEEGRKKEALPVIEQALATPPEYGHEVRALERLREEASR